MNQNPLQLVIFGISGDLARRKLIPAIFELMLEGFLPLDFQIIGVSRREISVHDVLASAQKFFAEAPTKDALARLEKSISIFQMDPAQNSEYLRLKSYLDRDQSTPLRRLFYLSVPAQTFPSIVAGLGESGLNSTPNSNSPLPHILVEKPFGYDLTSAHELINTAQTYFQESQIYRIDHYLAKETAQNLLVFRFDNPIFEPLWNDRFIESIHITAAEQIDIENRTDFYDQTGAMKDVIQSHLLQLLALVTMERPSEFNETEIHRSKIRLFDSICPADPATTLRAQYENYRSEVQNPESCTETFVRLHLRINNEKWRKTKISIETGKALDRYGTTIEINFRPTDDAKHPNSLVFRLQPSEGVVLKLQSKKPGLTNNTQQVEMGFNFKSAFPERLNEAYERVIADAVRGDQTLFASSQEVLSSWRILDPLVKTWSTESQDLVFYPKGANPDNIQ